MSAHQYDITFKSAMMWANSELEHVGRIASMKDADLQYAYAMSTLNGMAHLKDALYELVTDPAYETHHTDIQKTHDAVVRTMNHLKKEYNLDLEAIRSFNTRQTLSNLDYLEEDATNAANATESLNVNANANANENRNLQDGGRRRRQSYKKRKGMSRKAKKSRRH